MEGKKMKKAIYILFFLAAAVLAVFISSFYFHKDVLSSATFGIIQYPAFSAAGVKKSLAKLNSNVKANKKFSEESGQADYNAKEDRKIILESMIEEAILEKEAKNFSIKISDSEIEEEINAVIKEVGNKEQLETNLKKMFGWSIEDFKENIARRQIIEQKISEQISRDSISKINNILQRAKSGESFEDLAKQFSDCPSKDQGGDLGFFAQAEQDPQTSYPHMVAAFEKAAFALAPEEISGIVKTEFGWHIIKLEEKKTDESGIPIIRAKHILVKPAADFIRWLEEKKISAKVKIYLNGYKWKEGKVEAR